MPVMRHLNVGGTTYDTVGEASVTQVLSSGTKIATVSIDGTSTDLYAPAGGSSVDPATAAPSMDGTAAVGASAKYAREDHVHPTDTSRVPASATVSGQTTSVRNNGGNVILRSEKGTYMADVQIGRGGNASISLYTEDGSDSSEVSITPSGVSIDKIAAPTTNTMPATKKYVDDGLAAKQATLVSGTNIKTINNESLLGSGNISTPTYTLPTASTSTLGGVKVDGTTITAAADGTISASGGGGGGMYDLVIHVTTNGAGTAVLNHDADSSECMAFVEALESGDDLNAVAICRQMGYDDEDDIYNAGAMVLPLVETSSTSYGIGQYEVDGGWGLTFASLYTVTNGRAGAYILSVHGNNDDPQLAPTVTFSRR